MKQQFDINERFDFLNSLATMVVNGTTPSLIVTGEGGLGKTHQVTEAIGQNGLLETDYIFIKGYSTPRGLYNSLYDNNGKLIIYDDCDSVLEDKVALNVLKSALDSYDTRRISWNCKMAKGDKYPQDFLFTGRIIFISNKNKNSIDQAILSRSLAVDLSMDPIEKIDRMKFILENILPSYDMDVKNDALNFLEQNKDRCDLNLRTLIMVSKMRMEYPEDWKGMASYMIHS